MRITLRVRALLLATALLAAGVSAAASASGPQSDAVTREYSIRVEPTAGQGKAQLVRDAVTREYSIRVEPTAGQGKAQLVRDAVTREYSIRVEPTVGQGKAQLVRDAVSREYSVAVAVPDCSQNVFAPVLASAPASGSTGSFTIGTSSVFCAWQVAPTVEWISVTSGATGTGLSGTVTYSVAANASVSERVGTIVGANAVFTITQAGAPDCNGNGIGDPTDLASGTSPDCNANGIPDSCDVASGAVSDADGNGVPDPCQFADLVLVSLETIPPQPVATEPFELRVEVRNAGDWPIAGARVDRFFLSADAAVGGDELLAAATRSDPIAPGASATYAIAGITLPYAQIGTRHLVASLDSANDVRETSAGNANNVAVSGPIEIVHPARADLVVESVSGPSSAVATQPVEIVYAVRNAGESATSGLWRDRVTFVFDDRGRPPVVLGEFFRVDVLGAGESRSCSAAVLPALDVVGSGRFAVLCDSAGQLDEGAPAREQNNSRVSATPTEILEPPLPDLVVESVGATPAEGAAAFVEGRQAVVTWSGRNGGELASTVPFVDRVYLSADATRDPGDLLLGSAVQSGPLAPGATWTRALTVVLPAQTGERHVIVATDALDAVEEGSADANNSRAMKAAIEILPAPRADLVVEITSTPSSWTAGGQAQVGWRVENVGKVDATGPWSDGVFLSRDATRSADDVTLRVQPSPATLASGDSYQRLAAVQLPIDYQGGARYLIVRTDLNGEVDQTGQADPASDTAVFGPFTLVPTSAPDLVVDGFTATTEGLVFGQPISAEWTDRNAGTSATTGPWSDLVLLARSATPSSADVPIGLVGSGSEPLAPGGTRDRNLAANLPLRSDLAAGEYWLVVRADANASVAESDESNNLRVFGPVSIARPPLPNLSVQVASMPASVPLGQAFPVRLEITNDGAVSATGNAFVSLEMIAGGASTLLQEFIVSLDLAAGAPPLVVERAVTLPLTPATSVSLRACVDSRAQLVETSEGDNCATGPAATVERPDLVVESTSIPPSAQAGEQVVIGYVVRNQGTSATTGSFVDVLSLSPDAAIGGDRIVGTSVQLSAIAPGASVSRSATVTIPADVEDAQHVVVRTNVGQVAGETDFSNNARISGSAIAVTPAARPNLVVTSVSAPSTSLAGTGVSVTLTILNDSDVPADGAWLDAVRLSRSATPSPSDRLLGQQARSGPLAPRTSYSVTLTGTAPAEAGVWYVHATTDAYGTLGESRPGGELDNTTSPAPVLGVNGVTAVVRAAAPSVVLGTPIELAGEAFVEGTSTPAPGTRLTLRTFVRGVAIDRVVTTDAAGRFSAVVDPAPGIAGRYRFGAAVEGSVPTPQSDVLVWGARVEFVGGVADLPVGGGKVGTARIVNLGDLPMTGLAASIEVDAAGTSFEWFVPGGDVLGPLETRVATWTATSLPSAQPGAGVLRVATDQIADLSAAFEVRIIPYEPALVATPSPFVVDMLVGETTYVALTLRNEGAAATGPISIAISSAPWLSLTSPASIGPIPSGGSAQVQLRLSPPADLTLGPYAATPFLVATDLTNPGASVQVPAVFRAIDDATATLSVLARSEFSYYGVPPTFPNATVEVREYGSESLVAGGVVDESGEFEVTKLPAGLYRITSTSPGHGSFSQVRELRPGQNEVVAFMARQLVSYQWTVVQIPFTDQYEITLNWQFETNVPAPVLVTDPPFIDFTQMTGSTQYAEITVRNEGLITADDVRIESTSGDRYRVEFLVDSLGDIPPQQFVRVPALLIDMRSDPDDGDGGDGDGGGGGGGGEDGGDGGGGGGGGDDGGGDGGNGGGGGGDGGDNGGGGGNGGGGNGGSGGDGSGGNGGGCIPPSVQVRWVLPCDVQRSFNLGVATRIPPQFGCGGGFTPVGGSGGGGGGVLPGVITGSSGSAGTVSCECSDPGAETDECVLEIIGTGLSCIPVFGQAGCAFDAARCITATKLGDGITSEEVNCWVNTGLGCFAPNWIGCPCSVLALLKNCCLVPLPLTDGFCGVFPALPGLPDLLTEPDPDDRLRWAYPDVTGRTPAAEELNRRLRALFELQRPFFMQLGDPVWTRASTDVDRELQSAILAGIVDAATEDGDEGARISGPEWAALMSLSRPSTLGAADVERTLARHNRTADYWALGIFTRDDVPVGQSLDFVDRDLLEEFTVAAAAVEAELEAQFGAAGIVDVRAWIAEALTAVGDGEPVGGQGQCVTVGVQLSQTLTLTRQAFAATLVLENGTDAALEGLEVDLVIEDAAGVDRTSRFAILGPALTDLADVDGGGSLAPGGEGSATWTIVPGDSAAPNVPTPYSVRGQMRYSLGGSVIVVPLFPVAITVHPNASLALRYFLETRVYSDDPFTPEIEPTVPFALGLWARNEGAGTAYDVRIESAQPEIVSSELGLLIDFQLIGTQVNDTPRSPSLLVDLGDVLPGAVSVAQWLMTSSIQGEFVGYDATVRSVNGFDDPEFSVVDAASVRAMTHVVRADEPFDDGRPDFLGNLVVENEELPDSIHLSSGVAEPVVATVDPMVTVEGLEATIVAGPMVGWRYVRIDDPFGCSRPVESVTRSDGKSIRLGDNAWQTSYVTRDTPTPEARRFLHLFDRGGDGTYRVVYSPDLTAPRIESWQVVKPHAGQTASIAADVATPTSESRSGGISKLTLTFSEPVDAESFGPTNLVVTAYSASGAEVDVPVANREVVLRLGDRVADLVFPTPLPDALRYCIRLVGVTDLGGNALDAASSSVDLVALSGDVNGDLRVTVNDLGAIGTLLGTAAIDPLNPYHVRSDANRDGKIDMADATIVLGAIGRDFRFSTNPCTLGLAGLAGPSGEVGEDAVTFSEGTPGASDARGVASGTSRGAAAASGRARLGIEGATRPLLVARGADGSSVVAEVLGTIALRSAPDGSSPAFDELLVAAAAFGLEPVSFAGDPVTTESGWSLFRLPAFAASERARPALADLLAESGIDCASVVALGDGSIAVACPEVGVAWNPTTSSAWQLMLVERLLSGAGLAASGGRYREADAARGSIDVRPLFGADLSRFLEALASRSEVAAARLRLERLDPG